ncbi:hypothetical protein, partial [Bradyrhizobium sp.]|uniref:hypothetical protein n=1 Tax=Bradyrhizobium sp. TaxID=376 RepID=UPI002914F250
MAAPFSASKVLVIGSPQATGACSELWLARIERRPLKCPAGGFVPTCRTHAASAGTIASMVTPVPV